MLYLETKKNGTALRQNSRERRGNIGACGGRSEQITGSERREERVVGGLLSRHGVVNTATCGSQTNRTPVFLPLLLDCLFLVEETKHFPRPYTRNQGKENAGFLTKMGFYISVLFCFGCPACCFPRRWPKTVKSNSVSV